MDPAGECPESLFRHYQHGRLLLDVLLLLASMQYYALMRPS